MMDKDCSESSQPPRNQGADQGAVTVLLRHRALHPGCRREPAAEPEPKPYWPARAMIHSLQPGFEVGGSPSSSGWLRAVLEKGMGSQHAPPMRKTASKEREARKSLCGFLSEAQGAPLCGAEATINHGLMTQTSGGLQPQPHAHPKTGLGAGWSPEACPPPMGTAFLRGGAGEQGRAGTWGCSGDSRSDRDNGGQGAGNPLALTGEPLAQPGALPPGLRSFLRRSRFPRRRSGHIPAALRGKKGWASCWTHPTAGKCDPSRGGGSAGGGEGKN